jgi:hypothetical protein
MEQNLKIIKKLDLFFIGAGIFELFVIVFISHSIWMIIFGLITIIPAYIALNEKNMNWNYFVSIWAMVKYNPIILIALVAFILGDFYRVNGNKVSNAHEMSLSTIILMIVILCFFLVMFASLALGIVLLVKTIKHKKLMQIELLNKDID